MEKVNVMPLTNGVPSKYCVKSVLANNKNLAQSNQLANNTVTVLPINIKKMEIPIARELFRKTDDIINAIVVSIRRLIEFSP